MSIEIPFSDRRQVSQLQAQLRRERGAQDRLLSPLREWIDAEYSARSGDALDAMERTVAALDEFDNVRSGGTPNLRERKP